jgi:hypothetical protein
MNPWTDCGQYSWRFAPIECKIATLTLAGITPELLSFACAIACVSLFVLNCQLAGRDERDYGQDRRIVLWAAIGLVFGLAGVVYALVVVGMRAFLRVARRALG